MEIVKRLDLKPWRRCSPDTNVLIPEESGSNAGWCSNTAILCDISDTFGYNWHIFEAT